MSNRKATPSGITARIWIIENEKMYGFHGHFSSGNQMLFFGGGFKGGYVHGKTAPRHPMVPGGETGRPDRRPRHHLQGPRHCADHNYVTEGRPFYVTNLGKGQPIDALLA